MWRYKRGEHGEIAARLRAPGESDGFWSAAIAAALTSAADLPGEILGEVRSPAAAVSESVGGGGGGAAAAAAAAAAVGVVTSGSLLAAAFGGGALSLALSLGVSVECGETRGRALGLAAAAALRSGVVLQIGKKEGGEGRGG